jgi:two-component system, NarL family, response regulator LiaR
MNTILYSDDVNLLSHWEKVLSSKFSVCEDLDELFKYEKSLIIINFSACEGSCENVLSKLKENENKVLVLHRVPNLATGKRVLQNGAMGYGNAMMREHFILSALETIKDGMVWLYPEFTSELITQIPSQKNDNEVELQKLSQREKDVAILLKDGDSYKTVAQKLDITPRTVKAHATSIYAKLGVQDRIGLALLLK